MRIGELAERAGTSARSLRYYEQQGLLDARRTTSGHRDYDESDLRVVREIRSLLAIGFGLAEARPFVECLRAGHDTGDACPASVAVYRRKLAEVEDCLERMSSVRDHLRAQLANIGAERQPTTGENPCHCQQGRAHQQWLPTPVRGPGP